ncbi:MAG: hypothetical protein WCP22_03410 [Chlamydiota bacterium]
MRKALLPAALAVLCVAGIAFAQTSQKESEVAKQFAAVNAKLDTIVQNQAKLDTIIANQEKILQKLIIIRQH